MARLYARWAPTCNWSVDMGLDNKVEAFLMLGEGWAVSKGGNHGGGSFVWFDVESEVGPFFVGFVNAPASCQGQDELWDWMMDNLPLGTWLLDEEFQRPQDHRGRNRRVNVQVQAGGAWWIIFS